MKTVKCIYCSKCVKVSRKGHLLSHLNGGGSKCVGIGLKASQMAAIDNLLDPNRKTDLRR